MNFKMLYVAMNIIIICHMTDICAMRRAYSLPVQTPYQKAKAAQEKAAQEKAAQEKAKEEKAQKLLLPNEEIIFVKTKDDAIIKLPRWQINQMPVLFKELSEQKDNSFFNPLDVSHINGGIDGQELELLSQTWNHVRNNQALTFLESLQKKPDFLSLLQGASEKVGSSLLYATIFDYLLPRELRYRTIAPLIVPLNQLLEKAGYLELQNERLFKGVANKKHNPESPDGTKWVSTEGNRLLLYDEANGFSPQELEILNPLSSSARYAFSADSRMVVAIANEKGKPLRYWDTHNKCKQYTVQCSNFVAAVEFSSDGTILVFTESDQPVVKAEDKGNKLYACNLNEDNPVPQQVRWKEDPISSITLSPNNEQLICISITGTYYYKAFKSTPFKVLDYERFGDSAESVIFTQDSTKYVLFYSEVIALCDSNRLLRLWLCNQKIHGEGLNPVGTVSIVKTSDSLLYASVNEGGVKSFYKPNSIDSIGNISFSPDSKICAFTDNNCLCYCNLDDFKVHKICEGSSLDSKIKSIVFSSDKKFSILVEGADSITKKIYGFGDYEDLKKCTIGQGEMLAKLCYTHLLKNAGEDKTSINIVKGTLSYELFKAFPGRLQDAMKPVLNITIIDKPESIEQEYAQMAIEEFLPKEVEEITEKAREIAMENLRQYLEKEKLAIDAIRKLIEEEEKGSVEQNKPTEKAEASEFPKNIDPVSKESIGLIQSLRASLSGMSEYIYSRLPIAIQKWIKGNQFGSQAKQSMQQLEEPTAEEKQPTAEEKQPTAKEKQPTAKEKRPTGPTGPTAEKKQPTAKEKRPTGPTGPTAEKKQPTAQEQQLLQQLTNEEWQQFKGDFSTLQGIIQARKNKEAEQRQAALEKAKEDMRSFFTQPRLQDEEAIAKTIAELSTYYQQGTIDYDAFHAVIKEMGFE